LETRWRESDGASKPGSLVTSTSWRCRRCERPYQAADLPRILQRLPQRCHAAGACDIGELSFVQIAEHGKVSESKAAKTISGRWRQRDPFTRPERRETSRRGSTGITGRVWLMEFGIAFVQPVVCGSARVRECRSLNFQGLTRQRSSLPPMDLWQSRTACPPSACVGAFLYVAYGTLLESCTGCS